MTREFSHEYSHRHFAQTAQDERAEALTRFGFLAIAGADRAVRGTLSRWSRQRQQPRQRLEGFRERRATYLALTKLDDRMLRDIGLSRADVEASPTQLAARAQEIAEAAPVPAPRPTATLHEFKRAA